MRTTTFLLFIFTSVYLSAQGIQLKEGEKFTFHTSTFQEKTDKTEDFKPEEYSEEYTKRVMEIEVLEASKKQYKLKIHIPLSELYSRKRKANSQFWTTNVYNYDDLGSNHRGDKSETYFIDLSKDGIIKDIRFLDQDGSFQEKEEPYLKYENLPVPLFPITKNAKVGQLVEFKNEEFLIESVNEDHISFRSTFDNSLWLVNKKGLVLEICKTTNIKNQSATVTNRSQKTTKQIYYDLRKTSATRLVNQDNTPFSTTLMSNKRQDTIFTNTNVRIRGIVKNAPKDESAFLAWNKRIPNEFLKYWMKADLSTDGSFEFRSSIDKMSAFKIGLKSSKPFDIVLFPGDDILIEIDAKNPEGSFLISGIGSENAKFMFEKTLFERKNKLTYNDMRNGIYDKLLDLNPEQMKKRCYGIYSQKLGFLEQFKNTLPPEIYLKEFWTYRLNLESVLREYYGNVQSFGKKLGKPDYDLPNNRENYFDFDSLIHADNDLMSFTDEYDHDIREYAFFHLDRSLQELSGVGNSAQFYSHNKFFKSTYIARYEKANSYFSGITQYSLKYSTVLDAMKRAKWPFFEELYDRFISEYPDTEKAHLLTQAYTKAAAVQPGQPAFDFELKDFDGNTVKLSDFKGKAVYLKFWDPKCCHVQLDDYGEQIDSIFSSKENIAIVYIALRTNVNIAKPFFEDKNISATKLVANPREAYRLMEKYYFQSLSQDIIIDTKGRIYDENAPGFQMLVYDESLLTKALDPG